MLPWHSPRKKIKYKRIFPPAHTHPHAFIHYFFPFSLHSCPHFTQPPPRSFAHSYLVVGAFSRILGVPQHTTTAMAPPRIAQKAKVAAFGGAIAQNPHKPPTASVYTRSSFLVAKNNRSSSFVVRILYPLLPPRFARRSSLRKKVFLLRRHEFIPAPRSSFLVARR